MRTELELSSTKIKAVHSLVSGHHVVVRDIGTTVPDAPVSIRWAAPSFGKNNWYSELQELLSPH